MEKVLEILELGAKAFIYAFLISMLLADTAIYQRLEDVVVKSMTNKQSVIVTTQAPVKNDIVTEDVVLYDILSQNGNVEINLNGTEITKKTILGTKSFFKNIKENDVQDLLEILPDGNYIRSYDLDQNGKITLIKYTFQ